MVYNRYMPYDIKQNYGDCKGYAVAGEDGKVFGCHTTRSAAVEQQRALYAAENVNKVDEWEGKPLYDMLSSDEKAFADSLLKLASDIGPIDQSQGIWVGYEDGSQNENAEIGVKCGNCALHKSAVACAILSQEIEENGQCRLAVIPDGYVNASNDMEDDMQMYKSDNEEEDKWDNIEKKCWVGYRQDGMKNKNGRMVPNCVPVKKSDDEQEVSKSLWHGTAFSGLK
jgi:hypothetical protein